MISRPVKRSILAPVENNRGGHDRRGGPPVFKRSRGNNHGVNKMHSTGEVAMAPGIGGGGHEESAEDFMISMTQEEQANDVRWVESPLDRKKVASRTNLSEQQSSSAPLSNKSSTDPNPEKFAIRAPKGRMKVPGRTLIAPRVINEPNKPNADAADNLSIGVSATTPPPSEHSRISTQKVSSNVSAAQGAQQLIANTVAVSTEIKDIFDSISYDDLLRMEKEALCAVRCQNSQRTSQVEASVTVSVGESQGIIRTAALGSGNRGDGSSSKRFESKSTIDTVSKLGSNSTRVADAPSSSQVSGYKRSPVLPNKVQVGRQLLDSDTLNDDELAFFELLEKQQSQCAPPPVAVFSNAVTPAILNKPTAAPPSYKRPSPAKTTPFPVMDVDVVSLEEIALFEQLERMAGKDAASSSSTVAVASDAAAVPAAGGWEICVRYMAIEVFDYPQQQLKLIKCSRHSGSDSGKDDFTQEVELVGLTGDWYSVELSRGDRFHIVGLDASCMGEASTGPTTSQLRADSLQLLRHVHYPSLAVDGVSGPEDVALLVDNTNGLLIVHPDVLISPSRIGDSCSCIRRGVISDRVRIFESSVPAVLGNLRHSFIEMLLELSFPRLAALQQQRSNIEGAILFTDREISEITSLCIKKFTQELYVTGFSDESALKRLMDIVDATIAWMKSAFTSGAVAHKDSSGSGVATYSIKKIVSSEESVWSPALGIKGQIDVITQSSLFKTSQKDLAPFIGTDFIVPFELKTGKRRVGSMIAHRAQVMLYILTLVVRERSRGGAAPCRHGMLLYINEEETFLETVAPSWHEFRALTISRNLLAIGIKIANVSISKAISSDGNSTKTSVSGSLPGMLKRSFECENCYQASECMVYHAAERGSAKSSGTPLLFSYITAGLSPAHLQYFSHWDMLISLESSAVNSCINQLWLMPSHARVSMLAGGKAGRINAGGKCLGGLEFVSCVRDSASKDKYILTLFKKGGVETAGVTRLFSVGDRIILSAEFAETDAAIVDIEDTLCGAAAPSSSALRCRAPWQLTSVEPHISAGSVMGDCAPGTVRLRLNEPPSRLLQLVAEGSRPLSLRIDEYDMGGVGIGSMRSNLVAFFCAPHSPRALADFKTKQRMDSSHPYPVNSATLKLRNLIIDLQPPSFLKDETDNIFIFAPPKMSREDYSQGIDTLHQLERCPGSGAGYRIGADGEIFFLSGLVVYPGCNPLQLLREYSAFNEGQRNAVRKVLLAQDYALLLGLPGTGKTSTLSLVVRSLLARGQKVLLSSYTHSAVDHLLQKVADSGLPLRFVIRLGASDSVSPSLRRCLLEERDISSIYDMKKAVSDARLVASTALQAARHPLLTSDKFSVDWCIVDEAGQISQPAILGAIMRGSQFVLVGDDKQLPPLVQSEEAAAKGMCESLLLRLKEAHPSACCNLFTQYRMNQEIMSLCNHLVYENQMVCDESVRRSRLKLPLFGALANGLFEREANFYRQCGQDGRELSQWLRHCCDPSQPVVFLNTDCMPPCRAGDATSASFDREVQAVRLIVEVLLEAGMAPHSMGIISPFRAQVAALSAALEALPAASTCDISTVDKFQGRDKDFIMLSTQGGQGTALLSDWRRINVAVTRAKTKLVIIGSRALLERVPSLLELCKFLELKNWIANF